MKKIIFLLLIIGLTLIDAKIIKHNGKDYTIDKSLSIKYSELIKMILATESMDDDERQYWFDVMPSMTDEQADKLYIILDTERKKLEALEIKYQDEIKALNKKHLKEWEQFKYDQKLKFLEKMRKEEKNIDTMSAEELLDSL